MPERDDLVYAYITHRQRLLVMRSVREPTGGIKVPSGAVRKGESSDRAVLRIAREQTGLTNLQIRACLGQRLKPDEAEDSASRSSYYQLRHLGSPPDRWRPSGETYELFWVSLPDGLPRLAPGHDAFLGILLRCVAAEQS